MKKKKISEVNPITGLSFSDNMLFNSTTGLSQIQFDALMKNVLQREYVWSPSQQTPQVNVLSPMTQWAMGTWWSIDTNGYLINNKANDEFNHTQTNTFFLDDRFLYLIVIDIAVLSGTLVIQGNNGTTAISNKSFTDEIGQKYFIIDPQYNGPAHLRIYGRRSNQISIKSIELRKVRFADLFLMHQ